MKRPWWRHLPKIPKDNLRTALRPCGKPKPKLEPTGGETLDLELDAKAMRRLEAIRKRKHL